MRRFRPISLIVLILVVALGAYEAFSPEPAPQQTTVSGASLLVAVLDVGQADSILVRSPSGQTMLVDAGNSVQDATQVILPYLKAQELSAIDYLVLTHPHQDHVGGMPAVIEGVEVRSFVDSVQPGVTNQTYGRTLEMVKGKGIKPIKARAGRTNLDLGPEVKVEVLGPEDPLFTEGDGATNNNSVVLRLTYGAVSVLLTGDVETEALERMMARGGDLRSQILKVPHHGSRTGTTESWLEAVQPMAALISVGAGNSYEHPHKQALELLEKLGVGVFRTDRQGTLVVRIDGKGYTVETGK